MAVGLLGLAQNIGGVRFHRLHRNKQLLANLAVRIATREQPQDLQLAARERIHCWVLSLLRLRGGRTRGKSIKDKTRQARREIRIPAVHLHHRLDQIRAGNILRHVATRARPNQRNHVLRRIRHAQRQKHRPRRLVCCPVNNGEAAAVGHVDIKKHHVRGGTRNALQRLRDGPSIAHDLNLRGHRQLRTHARAEDGVIINQKDLHHAHNATASSTSVPSPGVEEIRTRPPDPSTRARILSRIPCLSAGISSTSKPTPRSRTKILSSPANNSA